VTLPAALFPKHTAATGRALLPEGVDAALCRRLLELVETEPEAVARQVRVWLAEEVA
jgi:flagellar biosynthesis/type III secretory pathway M-ring protein FliF/YscJ